MGAIAKEFFRSSPVLDFPLIALAIFVAVFIAVTVRTLLAKPTAVNAIARLPLEDGARQEEGHE